MKKKDKKTNSPKRTIYVTTTYQTLEIVIQIPLVDISVEKIWDDNKDQDGTRKDIDEVKVQLYRNDKVYKDVILSQSNNWTYTWDNLLDGYTYKIITTI